MRMHPPKRRMIPLDIELHCPQCGYDLRGIPEERCPECGFGFDVPALRDLAHRAALMVMGAYEAVFWRGAWLIGFSIAPVLPIPFGFYSSAAGAAVLVVVAVWLLQREYGSPRSSSELLIDWGLPLALVGTAWFSAGWFEVSQWALVAEMALRLFDLRRPFPQLPAALVSSFSPAVQRPRRRAYWSFCLGIAVAILI
ncbi:MAG: hypothetical protein IT449_10890 [Phycisphaerales bacterium]|nr:hypothetical protein [Phycisphaerales bacterium]